MEIRAGGGGSEPLRPEPVRAEEQRRSRRTGLLATGSLACPACDAPVSPGPGAMAPAAPLACPLCDHAARVRDFLSLAQPTRPAHVEVRVLLPFAAPRVVRATDP